MFGNHRNLLLFVALTLVILVTGCARGTTGGGGPTPIGEPSIVTATMPPLTRDVCLSDAALQAAGMTLTAPGTDDVISPEKVVSIIEDRASGTNLEIAGLVVGTLRAPGIVDGRTVWLASITGVPWQFGGGLDLASIPAGPLCTIWGFDSRSGSYVFGYQRQSPE
jgi:hypothetical protein